MGVKRGGVKRGRGWESEEEWGEEGEAVGVKRGGVKRGGVKRGRGWESEEEEWGEEGEAVG